jgi:hypothetical protein
MCSTAVIACGLLLAARVVTAAPQTNQSRRYTTELAGYRLFDGTKWGELIPLESTMADVRRVMGAPSDPRDIADYTKPYPGDHAAKQPVFSYRVNADWKALVYFGQHCQWIPEELWKSFADRVCSIELVPLKRRSFRGITFPPRFRKRHVDAADAGWDEYADGSGLVYEVYTTRTPYGDTIPEDLNRIVYGPSLEQIARHREPK